MFDGSFEGKDAYRPSKGTDVVLVVDLSASMEGERLAAAKEAAYQLVEGLQEGERIGLVSFSDSARVMHVFSSDKESLNQAVASLNVSGGTRYLPGLQEAASMFDGSRDAKRGIIFLSDGEPDDERSDIVRFARGIQEKGIVLFTIRFGSDGESSDILREIVSGGDEEVGRRHRRFQDEENIALAFSDAWDEISTVEALSLEPTFGEDGFYASQAGDHGVRVSFNSQSLTAEPVPSGLCVQEGLGVVARTDGLNVTLEPRGDRFVFPDGSLESGLHNFSFEASLRLNHDGTCVFAGSRDVEGVPVRNASCERMSCGSAREVLEDFDVAARTGALLPRSEGYGRVAIMVDSSESMGVHLRNVRRAADRVNRLLARGDERALVSFADEASLVQPLTRDPDEVTAALDSLHPQGTTRLLPALKKAGFLFQNHEDGDVVVMVTDGEFHDQEGEDAVAAAFEDLVGSGACLYVIGYGSWLNDAEHRRVFRDAAGLSQRELSCGGFTYAPDSEELASMVVDMFGGVRSGTESLRVVVERDPSVKNRLSFDVRVVSRVTGLELPYAERGSCVPFPPLEVEVRHDGRGIPVETWIVEQGEVRAITPHLLPGRYDVSVAAASPIRGCDLSGSFSGSFSIVARPEDPSESVVLGVILLMVVLMVWCGRRLQKSFQA